MKIRHWDEASQSWVIDGASNASNIELSNPSYVDSNGNSVTIDHGFTKVANKITKLEQNLAWVYLNGAIGGGTGGGGEGDVSYTIAVAEGSTVYTTKESIDLNVTISSGTIKKAFTLIVKNVSNGLVLGTWKIFSLTRTKITIPGLTGNMNIELSAYDSIQNYTIPTYVNIVAGAISVTGTYPNSAIYIGGTSSSLITYLIKNNIEGNATAFKLIANGTEIDNVTGITASVSTRSYDIRDIIFNRGLFGVITSGLKITFVAYAYTTLGTETITAYATNFSVTVANSDELIVITDGITTFVPSEIIGETYDDLTTIQQNSRLVFPYYLSYGLTNYKSFILNYNVYHVTNNIETEVLSGSVEGLLPNDPNRSLSLNVPWDPTTNTEYYKIKLYAFATDNSQDEKANDTKYVTFKILESESIILTANNDDQTLLAYYSNLSNFPGNPFGTWTYIPPTSGPFIYSDIYLRPKFPDGVKLTLKDVNGSTSGFLNETAFPGETENSIPGIRLLGESYGYLEVAEQMFPNKLISSGETFFRPQGFNISMTYKALRSSDSNEVIFNIGRYSSEILMSGIEITLEQVQVKIGSASTLICKLPQEQLLTIDIDISYLNGGWYFKVFINGVLSAVDRVLESSIDWTFAQDLYFGCRNDNGIKSRFSNVTFYDIKIYTSSQSDLAIVQNYISATEQASLILGNIDSNLDTELRTKNFFNSDGKCLLWKNGEYDDGQSLYTTLTSQSDNSYPVLLIEETSATSTLFEAYSTAIFSAGEKEEIMGVTFPIKLTYTDKYGTTQVNTPSGVPSDKGVRIGLQGTSSLSYNAKNFELYIGDKNISGDKLLFLPTDNWLPENEFTLKADVMDSSHVNNVIIGKVINGEVKNDQGENFKPFGVTPPMELGNSNWSDAETAESIRSKIKHTSDGFPVILFIRYAPKLINGEWITPEPKFKGIYNFNLGRYAFFNLGLKLLKSYNKDQFIGTNGPSTVTEYVEIDTTTIWNTGIDNGVYSIEINQNNSSQGAFQQDDLSIVKFMGDVAYSTRGEDIAYLKVQEFYRQVANMVLGKTPKYIMDDSGQFPKKLKDLQVNAEKWNSINTYALGEYAYNNDFHVFKSLISNNNNVIPPAQVGNQYWEYFGTINSFYIRDLNSYYNFQSSDSHLNWKNACSYFMIAMIFGMVDSMCKNLTLRSWGSNIWSTAFYDMDTAFGLNNQGQDIVAYYAHLHRWKNYNLPDSSLTSYYQINNYTSDNEDGVQQYFASYWNRLWEILENLPILDSGGAQGKETLKSVYKEFRENLFPDPEKFINDYYKKYTDQTGSILFNYDYKTKYLKIEQTYNPNTGEYIDTTNFGQLKFLHGNRVMQVRDWFKKRIYFLDSIYGITGSVTHINPAIESPITSKWADNKATGSSSGSKFVAEMSATSKILYRYSFDQTVGAFWLDETIKNVIVPIPNGETIVYIYANDYITNFSRFKSYPWTGLNTVNLPLLKELDLSNITNIPSNNFFAGGVYNSATDIGLKNIKYLNLSNVILTGDQASAYTLDVKDCSKLQHLNISNSSITNIKLSDSSVLKVLNLSGTNITKLELSNQAFLDTLLIDNCNLLTEVVITNCNKLTTLSLPKNVQKVSFINCELLNSIYLPYLSINNSISSLYDINVNNCPSLKNFTISGQNNPALIVNLIGAKNLENLNISKTNILQLTLPSLFIGEVANFTSLKSLDISETSISKLTYSDYIGNPYPNVNYLDLSQFPNLDNILASGCSNLNKVVCTNNENNPINLTSNSFLNCSNLTTLFGHFNILGSNVFRGCSNLKLNDELIYDTYGTSDFIEGNNVCNLMFGNSNNTLLGTFDSCSNLSYNDFKYIMVRIGPNITSLEGTFKECSKINGSIWYDLFRTCPNLVTIKEAFSGCKLDGRFYSRSINYSPTDDSTWGILDFIPNVQDAESAFENNSLEWIDNRVFEPIIYNNTTIYSPLVKIDKMFRGCSALKTCVDTRASVIDNSGTLNSETFFTNLRNLISTYPKEVFANCSNVKMTIINDGDNSYLFHTIKDTGNLSVVLDNSLYTGITLIGEVKVNIFGGKSRTLLKDGKTYYLPKFTSLQYPFTSTGSFATIKLSEMGEIFRNISQTLLQAIGVFIGLKIDPLDSGVIPADILKGCTSLNSIESLFSGLDLKNNNQEYLFPPTYTDEGVTKGMFDDCTSLRTTKNLFNGCNNLKIKLVGEGFKNCQLTNVSGMFQNSGLFDIIPYRLFFMEKIKNGVRSINRTIENMQDIFKGCWNLGYSSDRVIDTTSTLYDNFTVNWDHHIVKTQGTKISYKLNTSSMVKTYNYERDENLYILYSSIYRTDNKYTYDGNTYTLYDVSGIIFYKLEAGSYSQVDYDGFSLDVVYIKNEEIYTLYVVPTLYVLNPRYNPGEYAFDSWYLDGYGWENAIAQDPLLQSELEDQKQRLYSDYFVYDDKQKSVLIHQTQYDRYKNDSYQNYIIPTDLFRYCSKNATLANILKDLNWFENIIETNDETGEKSIKTTTNIEGLIGRIPSRLFESLVDNITFDSVFKDCRFDAFVGLNSYGSVFDRGIMFPPDLLKYNINLINIPSLFNNIIIPVGVDINTNLFYNLGNLKNVSQCFANCQFNKQRINIPAELYDIYPQINFTELFKYNTRISTASSLFAVYINEKNINRGLLLIDSTLLSLSYNIVDISSMFYNNKLMYGNVPLFQSDMYPILTFVNNYLYEVKRSNVLNEGSLETRLRPIEWLNQ